jgi:phosphoribosylformimino-5-aminoimidazole carboxamide ribotide isomerase
MDIIPAIDIIDGKCVRLTQGDYGQKKVYDEDPLEVAKRFEAHGMVRLHLVDLDGARARRIVNYRVLERLATHTGLRIDFGGGLKSDEDVRIAFESGAQQVTGGTVAVKQPELFLGWLKRYGSDRIILGADVRDRQVAVSGWTEASDRELIEFLEDYHARGVTQTICTDISRDGLLQGSALDLYREIRDALPELQLIASGGVSQLAELEELRASGCHGAIIGKALYEGLIALPDLLPFVEESSN